MNSLKIKKNDKVIVLTGKDKNKTGKVVRVLPKENKVVVEDVNIHKIHRKARSAQQVSTIASEAAPIDASNVMVVCPVCGKHKRVKFKIDEATGKKVRICGDKDCGAVLDKSKDAKEVKASAKKTAKKKTEEGKEEKAAKKPATKRAPRKTAKKAETEAEKE